MARGPAAQPYLGARTGSGDMMMDGVPGARACRRVRPLNLSRRSTRYRVTTGGSREPTAGIRWLMGRATGATECQAAMLLWGLAVGTASAVSPSSRKV